MDSSTNASGCGDASVSLRHEGTAAPAVLKRYVLFGFCLESSHDFRTPMTDAEPGCIPDLCFHLVRVEACRSLEAAPCLVQSREKNREGESAVQCYAQPYGVLMRFPGVADFLLSPREIRCELTDPSLHYLVEICLLGHVMAYYLELSGRVALHAGAVVGSERAVLLAGDCAGGKSTLVASLVEAGWPLLADDISALEVHGDTPLCRHGFPQMKLTPEQVRRFVGEVGDLPRVHPAFEKLSVPAASVGSVVSTALPVAAIFLLERRAAQGAVSIEPISPGEALIQLVRHSFLAQLLADHAECRLLGQGGHGGTLQASRFHLLSRIAGTVPVRRLCYPSGYQYLPALHRALEDDLPSR
ncbi:hypothetical protein ACM26W_11400 [Halomonas sp. HK25]|uniref:hypothetical protein n=1 Tax=Halomonas sp. HK25 TaxID=3394321 RepID=UPI0039FCF3D2